MPALPDHLERIQPQADSIANLHHFDHEAMHTTFEMWIVHEESKFAGQAAWAAFELLDRLEQELSRYIENSDVSQLNALSIGESLRLCLPVYECLQCAATWHEQTEGCFDVTVGTLLDCFRNPDKTARTPLPNELEQAMKRTGMGHIHLSNDFTATVDIDGLCMDLGGVGKGYGLDQMAELLSEWSIDCALLSGGGSTILAMAEPPGTKGWRVSISNPLNRSECLDTMLLRQESLSCSGLEKGSHIVDPRTGQAAGGKAGSWVFASQAAAADALSTALMVMSVEEAEQWFQQHRQFTGMLALSPLSNENTNPKLIYFNGWGKKTIHQGV